MCHPSDKDCCDDNIYSLVDAPMHEWIISGIEKDTGGLKPFYTTIYFVSANI
jgi:hypothetical protein